MILKLYSLFQYSEILKREFIMKRIAFILTLILSLLFGIYIAYSEKKSGIELRKFCKKYGYQLKINIDKEEFILKRNKFKVKFLAGSDIVLTSRRNVWFLDEPITMINGVVILPDSLKNRLIKEGGEEAIENNIPAASFDGDRNSIQFIVLDAGHGGKDPGNVHHGINEKQINMEITNRVQAILKEKAPNLKIYLTRNDDEYISLETRSFKAVSLGKIDFNGIFVSIHANASLNTRSKGIETYFYSSQPLKNSSERVKCISALTRGLTSHGKAHKIITKLFDYQISKESQLLADSVNSSIYKRVNSYTENRGIKNHQPYFVITHNNLPSILVETGFLTNREEARRLKSANYQYKVAAGISEGIINFVNKFNESKGFIE